MSEPSDPAELAELEAEPPTTGDTPHTHQLEGRLVDLLGSQLAAQGRQLAAQQRVLMLALVLIALLSGANLAVNVFGLFSAGPANLPDASTE